ncbi:MAG: helix-turn-helix domain-containing protein [Ruminiclostridium sp.]
MGYDNLPMILTPKEVQEVTGLPQNQVYRLFKSKTFPSERVRGKHIIPKPRFLNWLGVSEKEGA